MTTISPNLFSGQDYQMFGSSTSATASSAVSASSPASTTDMLLQALDGTSSSDSVSLSSAAQSILAQLDGGDSSSASSALSGLGSTSSSAGIAGLTTGGFMLTPQQQSTVADILAKYKDAPDTQATWSSIQSDLKAVGLGPDQLAAQSEVLAYQSADISIMASALGGSSASSGTGLPDISSIMSTEQSNANDYMQQVFNQWQSTSTTAAASGSDSSGSQGSGTDVTA